MVTMLHFDGLQNPVVQPAGHSRKPTSLQQLQSYLEHNPYDEFEDDDLDVAKKMLAEEMEAVRLGMAHELSLESYSQVWNECLSEVLYLPSQNRYTRAALASKKDRFESAEKKLEQNRKHMAKEAKRCGKIEKKLKVLTGGYQARAKALSKQLQDTYEQIEQNQLSLSTFKFLADQESLAIPRRLNVSCILFIFIHIFIIFINFFTQSLTEDVIRQMDREKQLQSRFGYLQSQFDELAARAQNNGRLEVTDEEDSDSSEEEQPTQAADLESANQEPTDNDNDDDRIEDHEQRTDIENEVVEEEVADEQEASEEPPIEESVPMEM